jgi:hypothetical protein
MHLLWDILSASGGLATIVKLAHVCREHVKKHGLHGSISSGDIQMQCRVGKIQAKNSSLIGKRKDAQSKKKLSKKSSR